MRENNAPLAKFTSEGGRQFVVRAGDHSARWDGDPLWSDTWPIHYDGKPAGKLYRSLAYAKTAAAHPRWHASIRELFWTYAPDAPIGVGFDVAAFDTADEAVAAWARSADEILDWSEGKPVPSVYSKIGVYQRGRHPADGQRR